MRAYKLSLSLVSLSLLLPGCNLFSIDPDEIDIADDEVGEEGFEAGDGDGDTAGESGTTGADTTAADDAGTDTGTEGDPTTDTTGDGDESTTDSGSDSSDSSTSDTGTLCGDFEPASECGTCMTDACCDQMLACEADDACACTNGCLLEGLTQAECTDLCGVAEGPAATDLGECLLTNCAESCA